MRKIKDNSLYLVTSREHGPGRSTLEVAKDAISAGIDILQMSEKKTPMGDLLKLGKKLAHLCSECGVIFIANDDPVLACQVGADGVHLGQEDLKKHPLKLTRAIIGESGIIGVSTHTLKQFKQANEGDCDYIAFGPIFSTPTKDYSIGTEGIRRAIKIAKKPIVFIGGINLDNVDAVLKNGAKNIAVIRAIVRAEDVSLCVKEFKNKIGVMRKNGS